MEVFPCQSLVINMPEAFADPAFQSWLMAEAPKFTWWSGGSIDEWSDVIVLVDPNLSGEGSDSDMPEPIWTAIIAACSKHLGPAPTATCHYMIRLTNLVS